MYMLLKRLIRPSSLTLIVIFEFILVMTLLASVLSSHAITKSSTWDVFGAPLVVCVVKTLFMLVGCEIKFRYNTVN